MGCCSSVTLVAFCVEFIYSLIRVRVLHAADQCDVDRSSFTVMLLQYQGEIMYMCVRLRWTSLFVSNVSFLLFQRFVLHFFFLRFIKCERASVLFFLLLSVGYVQSLIRRVVNNVNIVVNNLILKYVEDDIVLSVNITSAECYTVDDLWDRAFMDIVGEFSE